MRSVITDESFLVPSPANTKALETALALICHPHNRVNRIKVFTSFVLIIIIVHTKFSISTKTVLQVIIIFKKQRNITREWLGQVRLLLDCYSYATSNVNGYSLLLF